MVLGRLGFSGVVALFINIEELTWEKNFAVESATKGQPREDNSPFNQYSI